MAETNNYEMEINLKELVGILWKKKSLIIGLFIIAVASTFFIVRRMDPIYQTSATILVQENNQGMTSFLAGDIFTGGKNMSSTYSRIIKTRSLLNQVIEKMDLRNEKGELISSAALSNKIVVSPVSGTDLIQISIEDNDPVKAKEIVNNVVAVFQIVNVNMNKASLTGAREFIEEQKLKVERELRNVEDQLLKYKTSNEVILPTEEAKRMLQQMTEVEKLKVMADIELKAIDVSINEIKKELAKHSESVISSTVISNNPLVRQYKGQITDLESQLLGLGSKYTSNHPEIMALESKIKFLRESLNAEVQKEISAETTTINPTHQSLYTNLVNLEVSRLSEEAKLQGYVTLLAEYEGELEKLPVKELELVRLERKVAVTGSIYTMLMTRAEEFKISEAMETSGIYVVDPAYIPLSPIKPNKKMMLAVSGMLAIMAGVFIAFILEYLNTTVKNAEEVEKLLNLPVIGSIPDINKMKKR